MRLSDAEFDARWMGSLETIFMRACRAVKLRAHALWYRSSGVPACVLSVPDSARVCGSAHGHVCAHVRVVCTHGAGEDTRKESACRSICARGRRMMPPPPHSSHWNRSGKNGGGPSARNAALGRGTCANAAGNTPMHVRALTWRFSASHDLANLTRARLPPRPYTADFPYPRKLSVAPTGGWRPNRPPFESHGPLKFQTGYFWVRRPIFQKKR